MGRLSSPKTAYSGVHNIAPSLAFSGRAPHLCVGRSIAPPSPLGALAETKPHTAAECPGHCSRRSSPGPASPRASSPGRVTLHPRGLPLPEPSDCSSTLTPPRQARRFLPSHLPRRRPAVTAQVCAQLIEGSQCFDFPARQQFHSTLTLVGSILAYL